MGRLKSLLLVVAVAASIISCASPASIYSHGGKFLLLLSLFARNLAREKGEQKKTPNATPNRVFFHSSRAIRLGATSQGLD